uniref:Purine nucleoside phosphorylase n=1 Tax=Clastoptera arizonana TaxID=38151 RepID=A0A1B6C581_9HEMI
MSRVISGYTNGHDKLAVNSELNGSEIVNEYTYEVISQISTFLLDNTKIRPTVGIICGSGLGPLGDALSESVNFPYEKIPYFPQSTVPGHAGRLVFGKIGETSVVCMQGRFHSYEGYVLSKCSMPVRLMKMVGVTTLIVTNAAGGLNLDYKVGDVMIIKDHINYMGFGGNNPLTGPNDDRFGPRFFPMNRAYDFRLRKLAMDTALELGMNDIIREGVYAAIGGPNFETIAECRMLRTCGADAVGMSTIPEVLTAKHCGMTVFGFSLITNKSIVSYDCEDEPNHKEVCDVGKLRGPILKKFVTQIIEKIPSLNQTD